MEYRPMRKTAIVVLVSFGLLRGLPLLRATGAGRGAIGQTSDRTAKTSVSNRFLGTWKLVSIERRGANGQLLPPAPPAFGGQDRMGFIIYDPDHMAVAIMPSNREKYAGEQPTPQEAQRAMAGYTAYFGTYAVNEAEHFVIHQTQGAISPAISGTERKRFFEFSGNRLTLRPPPGANGVQSSLTWERVPDLPNLTATQRRLIGFWKLVSNERRNRKGEVVSSNPGQTGYIIYTASGHMMVHMMQPNRKKYASGEATPEESLATLRSYTSYFGPYTIHDTEHYLVHHRIGIVNPGQLGSDAQRFYEISGNRLMLKPPPIQVAGQEVQGVITWERVSADASRSQ
jgi:hypothetical protein